MRKSDEKRTPIQPEGLSSQNVSGDRVQKKLPLVGTDDFVELASGKYLCIDKTLFIHKFMLGDKDTLITFPRRWNKTTNLTMLEAFLSNHPDNKKNAELF